MSYDRRQDVRVERSAVLSVERSILDLTDLITAQPSSDFGIDLLAFRSEPFGVIPIQVKGAASGLTVSRQYASSPLVLAYVIDPLSQSPVVSIMSGSDAWDLPNQYVARGGRASDHDADNTSYRWASVTHLLRELLVERQATTDRWNMLFEENRAK